MEITILAAPVQMMRSALMDVQIWALLFPPGVLVCVCIPFYDYYYVIFILFFFLHLTTAVLSLPLTAPKPVFKDLL